MPHETSTDQPRDAAPEEVLSTARVRGHHIPTRNFGAQANEAVSWIKRTLRRARRRINTRSQLGSKPAFTPAVPDTEAVIQYKQRGTDISSTAVKPLLSPNNERPHDITAHDSTTWQLLQELATSHDDLQYTLIRDNASSIESTSGNNELRGGYDDKTRWAGIWERARDRLRRPHRELHPGSEELHRRHLPRASGSVGHQTIAEHQTKAECQTDEKHQTNAERQPNALSGLWNGEYPSPPNVPDDASLPGVVWWLACERSDSNSIPKSIGELRQMRRDRDKRRLSTKQNLPETGTKTRPQVSSQQESQSKHENGGGRTVQQRDENSTGSTSQKRNDIEVQETRTDIGDSGGQIHADQTSDQASSHSRVTSWTQPSLDEVPTQPLPNWTS